VTVLAREDTRRMKIVQILAHMNILAHKKAARKMNTSTKSANAERHEVSIQSTIA
jgi:hypothetical protein